MSTIFDKQLTNTVFIKDNNRDIIADENPDILLGQCHDKLMTIWRNTSNEQVSIECCQDELVKIYNKIQSWRAQNEDETKRQENLLSLLREYLIWFYCQYLRSLFAKENVTSALSNRPKSIQEKELEKLLRNVCHYNWAGERNLEREKHINIKICFKLALYELHQTATQMIKKIDYKSAGQAGLGFYDAIKAFHQYSGADEKIQKLH